MMMMKLDYESSKKEERKRSVKFTFSCLANRLVQVCRRGWNCVILMKEGGWGRRAAWKSTTWYDLHIRTYFHISYNARRRITNRLTTVSQPQAGTWLPVVQYVWMIVIGL